MWDRQESGKGPGADERGWLSLYQLAAVALFLAFVACLVVWTTAVMPGAFPEVHVEQLGPALASLNGAAGQLQGATNQAALLRAIFGECVNACALWTSP